MSLTLRRAVFTFAAAPCAMVLAACGLFGGSGGTSAKGVQATPRSSTGNAVSNGTTGSAAGPSASTPGAAPGAVKPSAATPSPVPTLRPKPGATLPCNAEGLVLHLAQASGAVHAYLAHAALNGTATVVALKDAATRDTASRAASYAADQLATGLAAAAGCATTAALDNVAKQTATYLTGLSKKLGANTATEANVSAGEALIQDVLAQAKRAGLTITDRIVQPQLLK